MPQEPILIEFSDRVRSLPRPSRTFYLVNGGAGLLLGIGLATPAVLLLSLVLTRGLGAFDAPGWEIVVGMIVLGAGSALLIRGGIRALRIMPRRNAPTPTNVFEIRGDTIHFPEAPGNREESWPLGGTSVSVTTGRLGKRLNMTCPGHRPRRYLAQAFQLPVETVCNVVTKQRDALDATFPWPQD